MSLLMEKLEGLKEKETVIVMADNRAFRGQLVAFDADTIILRNVVEAIPNNTQGWEEPTASTAIVHKIITWKGVLSQEDTTAQVVRLRDVMIRTAHVLRIWEWSVENAQEPEHIVRDAAEPLPGTRLTRRG